VLCQEDCAGLNLTGGKNLEPAESVREESYNDPRWEALAGLKVKKSRHLP